VSGDIWNSSKAVFENDTAHLLDLVGLRLSAFGLKIQDFCNPFLGKNVVTAADTLSKAQTPE
jgi:hypothetical protein